MSTRVTHRNGIGSLEGTALPELGSATRTETSRQKRVGVGARNKTCFHYIFPFATTIPAWCQIPCIGTPRRPRRQWHQAGTRTSTPTCRTSPPRRSPRDRCTNRGRAPCIETHLTQELRKRGRRKTRMTNKRLSCKL